jgi:hypothetical protein
VTSALNLSERRIVLGRRNKLVDLGTPGLLHLGAVSRATALLEVSMQDLLDDSLNLRHERLWGEKRNLASAVPHLQSYFVPA